MMISTKRQPQGAAETLNGRRGNGFVFFSQKVFQVNCGQGQSKIGKSEITNRRPCHREKKCAQQKVAEGKTGAVFYNRIYPTQANKPKIMRK